MRTSRWAVLIAATAITSNVALSQPVRWVNPAGGDWFTGANWSSGSVPTQGDDLLFDLDAAYDTVLLRYGAAAGSIRFTAGDVTLNGAQRLMPLWIEPLADPTAPVLRIGGAGRPNVTMRADVFAPEVVVGEDGPGSLDADGLRTDLLRLHANTGEVTRVDINAISPATEAETVRGLLTGDGEIELRIDKCVADLLFIESGMNEGGAASVVLESGSTSTLASARVIRLRNTAGNDACSLVVNAPLRVGSLRAIDADVSIGSHGLTCYTANGSNDIELQSLTRARTLRCSGPLLADSLDIYGGRLELDTRQSVVVNNGFIASEIVVKRGQPTSAEYAGVRFIAAPRSGPFSSLSRVLGAGSIEIYGGQLVYVGHPRPTLETAAGENGQGFTVADATIISVGDGLLRTDAPDTTPALAAYGELHVVGDLSVRSDRDIFVTGILTQSNGYRSSVPSGIYGSVSFTNAKKESSTSPVQISGVVNAQDLMFARDVVVEGVGYLSFADLPRIDAARLYLFHATMELKDGALIRADQFAVGGYSTLKPSSLGADFLDTALESALVGDGEVRGNLYNLGVVRPGVEIGAISVRGQYIQQHANLLGASVGTPKHNYHYPVTPGVLEIELIAPTEPGVTHDLLEISGDALLGGGLRILAPQGALPRGRYTFLTADNIDRAFESVTLPDTGDEPASVIYTKNAVVLVVGPRADLTDDGIVDARDLTLFLALRRAGDLRADFNGDGAVTNEDLALLLAEWTRAA